VGYDLDIAENSKIFTHAKAITKHLAFHLIGAVDVSSERRAIFEKRYGKPTYDNVEVALLQLKPDLVIVATPSGSHKSVIEKVLNVHRPKIILCEKPLANTLIEGLSIVESCEMNGVDLIVNYIRRSDPGAVEIKRRINNKIIIAPIKAFVWYSKGIFNNGSHLINLLEMWLGEIKSVKIINRGRLWDSHDPEPDFAIIFAAGEAIFQAAWEEAFPHYTIELLSPLGRLRYDDGGRLIQWQATFMESYLNDHMRLSDNKEIISNEIDIYQWNVYDQINNRLLGFEGNLCTGRQALNTLNAIDLIIEQRGL
jgi:predicted dehydrogenase